MNVEKQTHKEAETEMRPMKAMHLQLSMRHRAERGAPPEGEAHRATLALNLGQEREREGTRAEDGRDVPGDTGEYYR